MMGVNMNQISSLDYEANDYEIRVKGHLSPQRLKKFEYLNVTHGPNGDTILSGPLRDQAELYGLLLWLWDIGIPLVSVSIEQKS
jgi:hypothetical protein